MQALIRGRLVNWKPDKGYGFIRPADGSKDVFVHRREFGDIGREPQIGDIIHFRKLSDGTGRYRAAEVRVEGAGRVATNGTRRIRRKGRTSGATRQLSAGPALLVAAGFTCLLTVLFLTTALPLFVPLIYLVASLVAFLMYAFDKASAMQRGQRTSENTLLITGLLGGWPGALVAQQLFRHKSSKMSFQVAFWITVAVNCALLAWACSTSGAASLHRLLD